MSRGFRDAGAGAVDHVRGSQTSRRVRPIFLVVPRSLHRYYGSGDLHFIRRSSFQRKPFLAAVRYRDLFLKVLEAVRRLLISEPQRGTPATVMQALKLGFTRRIEATSCMYIYILTPLHKAEHPKSDSIVESHP